MTLQQKLNAIRECLDKDITGCDIETVVEKGKALSQLIGLSSECKAEARKNLERARLVAIKALQDNKVGPMVLLRMSDAVCADEVATLEYADRLNAGITHQLDFYRSAISLHKTEVQTALVSGQGMH